MCPKKTVDWLLLQLTVTVVSFCNQSTITRFVSAENPFEKALCGKTFSLILTTCMFCGLLMSSVTRSLNRSAYNLLPLIARSTLPGTSIKLTFLGFEGSLLSITWMPLSISLRKIVVPNNVIFPGLTMGFADLLLISLHTSCFVLYTGRSKV